MGTPQSTTDERYVLDIDSDPAHITVVYSSDRGRRWGTAHAQRLLANGSVESATVDEFPRFPIRGIVEGFYGQPWSHSQRLDMVRFLGSHRMNTFVYAPKDDVYCRRQWQQPYPATQLQTLGELAGEAASNSVDLAYGLSPGLSIRYSDDSEVDRLVAKYQQVADLGVQQFYLLLDDIPTTLQHPVDRKKFPDLVTAHIEFINRVRRHLEDLDASLRLTVCPTEYHGRGDEPYIIALGEGIDPRVDLLWTGRRHLFPRTRPR